MDFFNIVLGFGTIGILLLAMCSPILLKEPFFKKNSILLAGIITLSAVLGSLIYAYGFKLEPCPLCWYQRIFMFPLPIILLIAYRKRISAVWSFTLPLSVIGLLLSLYHIYIQFWSATGESVFCESGVSEPCNIPYVMIFGFITIPVMAGAIFLFTAVVSWIMQKHAHDAT